MEKNTSNQKSSTDQSNPVTMTIDDKTLGIIAHVGGFLTSFVAPLVIWLMQKDKSGMAKENALEALNFQITILIALAAAGVLSMLIIGFALYPLIYIANIVFSIMGAMAASNNQVYKYPFSLRLVK